MQKRIYFELYAKTYIFAQKKNMIAVITGDIINSQKVSPELWMPELKNTLSKLGKEPENWEIYRGDSFQLETSPHKALKAAILIKSAIKQFKNLDVRMAIGVGEKTYHAAKITESSGSAFVFSGETFEKIKKKTLLIKTPWKELDETMNLMLDLASLTMNRWRPSTSLIIKTALENPEISQKKMAILLGKKQSNISAALKRGGFYEIKKMIEFYQQKIMEKCPHCSSN